MKFLFIIARKPRNISELAKKGDFAMSVASTLISRWAQEGVVSKNKEKGVTQIIISLTEYGKMQVKLLKQLNNNHKKNKEEIKEEMSELVGSLKNNIGGGEK